MNEFVAHECTVCEEFDHISAGCRGCETSAPMGPLALLLRALDDWQTFYGSNEEDVFEYMTQLDHGDKEYEARIAVIEAAHALLTSGEVPRAPVQERARWT